MTTGTTLYIFIAFIAALILALFQYVFKSKDRSKLIYHLVFLRTLSIFAVLLLIINPKFESITYFNEKPSLILAVDNSESVDYLKQDKKAIKALNTITSHKELSNKFNIETYSFDKAIATRESLNFKAKQSNISNTLSELGEIYKNTTAPIILLSDGNQTYGKDYSYISKQVNQPIYSIALGDSITYSDLSIKQLNVNRYAFLKNRFPVEIIANYAGKETVNTELQIRSGNRVVFRKQLEFNKTKTSEIITTTLPATNIGIKTYKVELSALDNEKNITNNFKNFGIDVIDQKTNVAIVSEIIHPDIGTLKKAIESNEQRSATILKPKDYVLAYNDYQLTIFYQPNNSFREAISRSKDQKLNSFFITGSLTDWKFLNNIQDNFQQSITNQKEGYQPVLNSNYNNFIINNIDFSTFSPVVSEFGDFTINAPNSTILFKSVNGITTKRSLLSTYESNGTKQAILNGEGFWSWRAQAFLNTGSFESFDNFMSKLVQYLSSTKRRQRITIDYKSFYNGNEDVIISAQYFNKNYEFDPNAVLSIILKNKEDKTSKEFPLLLSNGVYKVDLSGIPAGDYSFSVKHNTASVTASGSFKKLAYEVEHQFLNADIDKLKFLSEQSRGELFYTDQTQELISTLLEDSRYQTIQKKTKKIVPLIDWEYLLFLLAFCLSTEWFIRKYNGLI